MNQQMGGVPPAQPNQQPPQVPFEMPQDVQQEPVNAPIMEPSGGGKKWFLIILIVVFVVLIGLVLASWQGWVSLGGFEKYLGLQKEDQTTVNSQTNTSKTNANDNLRKADLTKIKDALKQYFLANQSYPVSQTVSKTVDQNNPLTVLVPNYLTQLPIDPLSPSKYYGYVSDGKTYTLTCVLEDETDPTGIKTGNLVIYKITESSTETPASSSGTSNSSSNTTNAEATTTSGSASSSASSSATAN